MLVATSLQDKSHNREKTNATLSEVKRSQSASTGKEVTQALLTPEVTQGKFNSITERVQRYPTRRRQAPREVITKRASPSDRGHYYQPGKSARPHSNSAKREPPTRQRAANHPKQHARRNLLTSATNPGARPKWRQENHEIHLHNGRTNGTAAVKKTPTRIRPYKPCSVTS